MSGQIVPEAADALAALVRTVRDLPYDDASMAMLMYAEHWEVGVDAGDSVDDVCEWEAPDLVDAVTAVHSELRRLYCAESLPDRGTDEDDRRDFVSLLRHLEDQRPRLRTFPLSLAYIPRSKVVPSQPWELLADFGTGDALYSGDSALAAVLDALTGAVEDG